MSMLPASRFWDGKARGLRAAGISAAFGAISIFVTTSAFAAESPADILKKMAEVYTKAKSYQVSVTTQQSGKTPDGKAFSVTQSEKIQYQSPNLFHKVVKLAGSGAAASGQGAAQLALRQGEIFSDGKTATMYVPSRKMYQKQPVPPTVQLNQLVDLLRLVPPINRPGLALLPDQAKVRDRPVYVIEIKPVIPPNLKPADKKKYQDGLKQFKQFPRFMIDKQNYNLLEYTLVTVSGNAQVDLNSQVFGGAIPGGSFSFSPPAGAKEFVPPKTPPGGAPGGIPGGGLPGGVPGGTPGGAPIPGGK